MAREPAWTTKGLLLRLAETKNLNTDYQISKFLQADRASVSLWMKGVRVMSDDWGKRVAAELGLDPVYVCLCLAAERSPDANLATQMREWLTQHASAALIVFAVFSVLSPTSGASDFGANANENDSKRCILCQITGGLFATVTGRFLSVLVRVGTLFDRRHICAAGRRIDRPARLSVTA